jgi:hypothetical protein
MVCALASPALGLRKIAPEIGYRITSRDDYGSAFAYGVSLIEGAGRFGWGFTFLGHSNSTLWESTTKQGVFRHKEELSDNCLTLLGTWIRQSPEAGTVLVAGLGPQIHFLGGTRIHFDQGYSESARESRLGIGLLGRYERPVPALGSTTFIVTASFSWMEAGVEPVEVYGLPAAALTSGAVTIGLAFPF